MSPVRTVVIVGAGPKGIGLLERITANAPELLHGRLVVHLVDPFPPGPGRVWRFAQSPLLRMNSMPEDVTMFTDDTVRCDGPIQPGPTLAEWVSGARDGTIPADVDDSLTAELSSVTATTFPTRRLQSAYLTWFYERVLATLPKTVEVHVHATRAADVTGTPDGVQTVWLADGPPLVADVVVLALGHLDATPGPEEARLGEAARGHGLRYLPPAYTADLDLWDIEPGEPVLLRGFGLAFVDLAVLLTEGRGGRFTATENGALRYLPSGAEPVLWVGSRRGVPYHAKPGYRLRGAPLPLPRFFGPGEVAGLLATVSDVRSASSAKPGRLDFRTDVWPLMAKDIGWGYYHELFTGHPDRVRMDLDEFTERYAALDWDSTELRALVAKAVPDEADHLDLAAIDRPLRGLTFADRTELTEHVRAYVEADLARRADPSFSADLGAFLALLSVFGQLAQLVTAGKLTPESQVDDVDNWWFGFFSFFASGPPGHRLQELLALVQAGVVRFVGPDMRVRVEEGRFVAESPAVPGTVAATTLVDARLPAPSVRRATDPLLRNLFRRGELAEEVLLDADVARGTGRIHTTAEGLLVDSADRPHPRRFALGPHTSARSPGAFTRPRTNAPGFRQNDAVARHILAQSTEQAHASGGSVSSIIALAGSPSVTSRTVALLNHLAAGLTADGHDVRVVPVRALPAEALLGADAADPAIAEVVAALTAADAVIVGSPVYKAAYSGVLKTFLDLLPASALAGKAVLPVLTGGAPVHALAVDYALRPVLTALGAAYVVPGLFLVDKQIDRTGDGVALAPDVQATVDTAVGALRAALPVAAGVRR